MEDYNKKYGEFDADAINSADDVMSYRAIIIRQIYKVSLLGSRDFYGGYWYVDEDGKEKYCESPREAFMNAVETLYNLTKFMLSDKAKEETRTYYGKFKDNFNNLVEKYRVSLGEVNRNDFEYDCKLLARKHRKLFQIVIDDLQEQEYFDTDTSENE